MKPKEKPTKLLWLDLEMTGLDASKDRILEVAVIITDFTFAEFVNYETQIKHDQTSIKRLLDKNEFWAKRPAEVKKLLAQMQMGKSENEVENKLVALVEKYFLPGEQVYLAGNSIRVDRAFIDYWWPNFANLLHYRMLDVSSFKLWWTGRGGKEFVKKENHQALDDIRESIAELKYYTDKMKFNDKP